MYSAYYDSPLGEILLCASEDALTGLWFVGQKYCGEPGEMRPDHPVLNGARRWLDCYFAGKQPDPGAIPLDPQGSRFRREVWQLLQKIPYGQVTTYGNLAAQLAKLQGRPCVSAQAVGGAVGHNPISILIPCHRVIGSDGSLTGYAGGTDRKQFLLDLERTSQKTSRGK